jgi:hypothetical protein
MRVHATIANGISQMQWEALPEHRRDVVNLNEAGRSSWISSQISSFIIVLLPHFRVHGRIYVRRVSHETLAAKTDVECFDPRQQYTPFDIQGERVNLVFRMEKEDIFSECMLSLATRPRSLQVIR